MIRLFVIILFFIHTQLTLASECPKLLVPNENKLVSVGQQNEMRVIQLNLLSNTISPDEIFSQPDQVTLIGASSRGHFYLYHQGLVIESRVLTKIELADNNDLSKGVLIIFKNLSSEHIKRLTHSIESNKEKFSISCSDCLMRILSDAEIDLSGSNAVNQIFSTNTFRRLLKGSLTDYNGDQLQIEIIETIPGVVSQTMKAFKGNDFEYSMKGFITASGASAVLGAVGTVVYIILSSVH